MLPLIMALGARCAEVIAVFHSIARWGSWVPTLPAYRSGESWQRLLNSERSPKARRLAGRSLEPPTLDFVARIMEPVESRGSPA
jgi:hypothetical protein